MRYYLFRYLNWFSLKCTLSRKRERGVHRITRQSVSACREIELYKNQRKGGAPVIEGQISESGLGMLKSFQAPLILLSTYHVRFICEHSFLISLKYRPGN